jgi:hypothetical protein
MTSSPMELGSVNWYQVPATSGRISIHFILRRCLTLVLALQLCTRGVHAFDGLALLGFGHGRCLVCASHLVTLDSLLATCSLISL